METLGMIGIGDAATYVGVSEALLRRREDEGVITPIRVGAKAERRYTYEQLDEWSDAGLLDKRPPGRVPQRVLLPERVPLSFEDEQECLRIAQAVTTSIVRRVGSSDWDEAFSDALVGIAVALSKPTDDCPWNVSCFTHARWAVLTGIKRRSGIFAHETAVDCAPQSLEEALGDTSAAHRTALDNTPRLVDRVMLEQALVALDGRARTVVVNSSAHQFTDAEIAEELAVSRGYVGEIRRAALRQLRRHLLDGRDEERAS